MASVSAYRNLIILSTTIAMFRYIFFFALLLVFGSCAVSGPAIPGNQYDSEFFFYAKKINRGRNKTKNVDALERNFRMANERDLQLIDTLLHHGESRQWPVINHIYRRVQERQSTLVAMLPIKAKSGYAPTFPVLDKIDQLESESRINAANYLYARAELLMSLAESGNHQIARDAFSVLDDLNKNYMPHWKQTDSLLSAAKETGTTRILLRWNQNAFFDEHIFWDRIYHTGILGCNSWQVVDEQPVAGRKYHYWVDLSLSHLTTGWEHRSETENSYTKEIQTGEKVVRDSSGQVVERTPILETVNGTIKEVRITKNASATLWVTIIDRMTGEEVENSPIYASESFDQTWVSTSGDSRALPCTPVGTGFGLPAAPSDWDMIDNLADQIRFRLSNYWNHL